MRKCALTQLDAVFAAIAEKASLYLPVEQTDGSAAYTKWEEGTVWSQALNTVRSPKDFFFPQTEDLMAWMRNALGSRITDVKVRLSDGPPASRRDPP